MAGPIRTMPYDSADYLDSEEAIAAYLKSASEDADPALTAYALEVAARARLIWLKD